MLVPVCVLQKVLLKVVLRWLLTQKANHKDALFLETLLKERLVTTVSKTAAWQRKEGKNPEGGLNAKGRASAKKEGHNLKPPVSAKQAKKSPKSAARRKSFCARMGGMEGPMEKNGKPTRKALALRKWDC